MSHALKLQILRLRGWTDERISVALGENMNTAGPSSMTVYRWRTGKTKPAKVFQEPLESFYTKQEKEEQ